MISQDLHHFRPLLKSCENPTHLNQIHAQILKQFPNLQYPPIFQYNVLIRGLAAGKSPVKALSLYRSLLQTQTRPNNFTFPFLLKACSSSSSLVPSGLSLHAHIVRTGLDSDPYIQSSLIHMYAAVAKDVKSAQKVFDLCSVHQTVCWNSMLDGLVKCGEIELARLVFDRMGCRDIVSWNTMINGYSLVGDLKLAREVFDKMPCKNLVSWNSILGGYNKCGDVEGALRVFREMPHRDVVSWNTMLACYAQSGNCDEAFELFDEMQHSGVKPTDATVVSMISVCAHLGALERGEWVHKFIKENKIELNTILATTLVDMYAKCGEISRAYQIFYAIVDKDFLAWNAIIAGVAVYGQAREALRLLDEMRESGSVADDMTFAAVLSACSHAGMVKEGKYLLDCMKVTYGVEPKVEHYGCVIDLLARKGLLDEAVLLMESMPMEPNAPVWGALLGGCRIHGNSGVADDVGRRLLSLQPKHSGRYVLLSNIYASINRWEDASKIRSMMTNKGISKIPGTSMIELKGILHKFVAGDQSHPESKKIYQKFIEVSERLKVEVGYSPDTKQVLLDIEEEEKGHILSVHSEKLAISFGLLHTGLGATIRIIKNLRVCRDCHHLMKLISKVYDREIVMRDRNRFHLFKDGACSCMDYW
ncbi:pentatricopeptide repeat-containing protein At1g08070, chloroplastic-like [Asparagus officinalis]|uniref:pentatricopeptide repeat-containing protein At1g08070, chloroplastic-like n=1 Tax=Asparagus officinalis TaxID=4686 RepID=UPI00098E62C8|nr:pentatricopeptide repeat-containing protein At1g08070, chloroplastic-like [Asparagus officinalis]XP_020247386.1 pentatricopeptide repeat-containing protein At1g08070, chloroplastic-like [Asparagus officinalis]XP_020247387.1 pentatricopeptide repeat-containing protein At1g08070, chloroplastic-like [Asparagus officinalis]XP_020247389.1 pentatricopeptide repeat-containing protein At1g08070, chloroplastic-like [Asparagus officinalis]XP_020247390.1 pentatricopeptide repeat-containing protein At1g